MSAAGIRCVLQGTIRGVCRRYVTRIAAGMGMLLLLPALILSQVYNYPRPADPKQLAIMAWGPSPSDPGQLQIMKEAGFNVSGFCPTEDLDKVAKAGLKCFVSDPNASGYDWTNLPSEDEIKRNAAALSRKIGSNRAALGILLKDEPGAAMLPGLGKVAGILKQQMPELWPFVNGFPFNASRAQIGAMSYDSYLRAQVRVIGQPFLSYDHYAVADGSIGDSFYANLEIARRASVEVKAPFWTCILAVQMPSSMEPSDATLGAQAYSTLAYGGRGIIYFTYLRPDEVDFTHTAIDGFGNRTPIWDMLRRLNGEILKLAPILVKLHSTGVYHYPTGFEPEQTDSQIVDGVRLVNGRGTSPAKLLIGEFADDQDHKYLMLVNKSLASPVGVNLRLVDKSSKLQKISPYSGQMRPFDLENGESLDPGAGMLLAIDP